MNDTNQELMSMMIVVMSAVSGFYLGNNYLMSINASKSAHVLFVLVLLLPMAVYALSKGLTFDSE